ncbi:hypothetical protein INR49_024897 [Caranx melampygus]|nr:hypothetical protein INR49_024897 [Caranx melampygus]
MIAFCPSFSCTCYLSPPPEVCETRMKNVVLCWHLCRYVQKTDQSLGNHPNFRFRGKMEIKLSHSHHHLGRAGNDKREAVALRLTLETTTTTAATFLQCSPFILVSTTSSSATTSSSSTCTTGSKVAQLIWLQGAVPGLLSTVRVSTGLLSSSWPWT